MISRASIDTALQNPNLRAFLVMIRHAEGTAGLNGYRTRFGGGLLDGLVDHPRDVVTLPASGGSITSSAAGAYQFLAGTWADAQKALGLDDFGPANQDRAAVWLIDRRQALGSVLCGEFARAVADCSLEWASLPGAPYGQPVRTLEQCRAWYVAAGGRFGPVSDTPLARRQPAPVAEATIQPVERNAMNPFVQIGLQAVASALPEIGARITEQSPAAAKVVEIAKVAAGAANEQHLAEKVAADPKVRAAVRQAVKAEWFELAETGGGGIAAARQFAADHEGGRFGRVVERVTMAALLFLAFANLAIIPPAVWAVLAANPAAEQLLSMAAIIMQADIGAALTAFGFWLGSSVAKSRGAQVQTP
ncbi:MAG: glycoside hydrolase family 104 protein [Rhodocyclaceae bacterium]|nr:glycoside hydrolase family 104 protein [Rhodocyclaceae bacterium]